MPALNIYWGWSDRAPFIPLVGSGRWPRALRAQDGSGGWGVSSRSVLDLWAQLVAPSPILSCAHMFT